VKLCEKCNKPRCANTVFQVVEEADKSMTDCLELSLDDVLINHMTFSRFTLNKMRRLENFIGERLNYQGLYNSIKEENKRLIEENKKLKEGKKEEMGFILPETPEYPAQSIPEIINKLNELEKKVIDIDKLNSSHSERIDEIDNKIREICSESLDNFNSLAKKILESRC